MMKRPTVATLALGLIGLIAVLWAAFGAIVVANLHPALPDEPAIRSVLGLASFLIAVALVFLWVLLIRQNRWAYMATLILLGAFILATFLDDVGWADLVFVGLCALGLGLLLKERKWFFRKTS
jgi:hypothetical protein